MYSRISYTRPLDTDHWIAVERLHGDPAEWLPSPARPAGPGAWRVVVQGGPADHDAVVTVGRPWSVPDSTSRRLTWRPVSPPVAGDDTRLLPAFSGRIAVHDTLTGPELEVSGWYRPPLGFMGALLDRVGMRLVARSTLRTFASTVAGRLEQNAPHPVTVGS